ncbi:hypothetical protein USB125703_02032 [Pseudoclavibacter triregionum]|nr:hypothetical protein USB125703_02032 [Pseudoclavibacter triregionum]
MDTARREAGHTPASPASPASPAAASPAAAPAAGLAARLAPRAIHVVIPAIWAGMLIAIDGIEAPLKFTAPGITIPLGLGIGRLVFTAVNAAELLLAVVWLASLLLPRRAPRAEWMPLAAASAILLVKIAVIRPLLWAHTDAVLSGASSGGSMIHILYIGADLLLGCVLLWAVVRWARGLRAWAAERG